MAEPSSGIPPYWMKSSASGQTGCVEVRCVDSRVQVRDSKKPHSGILEFSGREWEAFLVGVSRGEFRLPRTALAAESH